MSEDKSRDPIEVSELPLLLRQFARLSREVLLHPSGFVRTYVKARPAPLRFAVRMFLFSVVLCVLISAPALIFAAGEPKKGLFLLSALLDAAVFSALFYMLCIVTNLRQAQARELLALCLVLTAVFNPIFELFYLPVDFLLPAAVTPSFCPSASIAGAVDRLDTARFIFLFFYTSIGNWALLIVLAVWYGQALGALFGQSRLRVVVTALLAMFLSNWLLIAQIYPFVCAREDLLNRIIDSVWN